MPRAEVSVQDHLERSRMAGALHQNPPSATALCTTRTRTRATPRDAEEREASCVDLESTRQRAPGSVKIRAGGDSPRAGKARPQVANERLNRWDSGTDGESPDGRRHVSAEPRASSTSGVAGATPRSLESEPRARGQDGMTVGTAG